MITILIMNVESELNIPQEDWYETFIRYGLYFGAVFQLLCLCACVMLPGSTKVKELTKPFLDVTKNFNYRETMMMQTLIQRLMIILLSVLTVDESKTRKNDGESVNS